MDASNKTWALPQKTIEEIFNYVKGNFTNYDMPLTDILKFVQENDTWLKTKGVATIFIFLLGGSTQIYLTYPSTDGSKLEKATLNTDSKIQYKEFDIRIVTTTLAHTISP